MDLNLTPVITQLTRNNGAIMALAKFTIPEDKVELFLLECEIQAQHSMLDFIELNPKVFDDLEKSKEIVNKNINELKKRREELSK